MPIPSLISRRPALRILLGILACSLTQAVAGQATGTPLKSDAASSPFQGFAEDWTTPSLTGTHLQMQRPVGPMFDPVHEGYTLELYQLQWRPGDPLDVYVLKPVGVKKPPVIVNLYGYPADTDPYKIEAVQKDLVKDGFAAVGFVSALTGHRYHGRPAREWFLSELQESLATSAHDVQMLLDYLTTRGDLDMNRAGMFGNGSGATIAILASAVDPRIKVLDVLDPWGDWPSWMATSAFPPPDERAEYITPEFLKKISTLDTLDWLPKIQAKKFRLQQDLFETDTAPPIKEKLRATAPAGTVFVQYRTPDEFKAAFPHSSNLDWMKQQLKAIPNKD